MLQLILDNPYRVLGLSITATDREIVKRSSELSIYAEMGKSKSYKYDFLFLGEIDRSLIAIEKAKKQLEQPKDKVIHSIFWLDYDISDTYLETLDNTNFSETIREIPEYSIEHLHNKAVLLMLSHNTISNFRNGLRCFDKFFNHPDIDIYTDETIYSVKHRIDLFETFIDSALPTFIKTNNVRDIMIAFEDTSKAEYVKERIIKPILNDIELDIDAARTKTNLKPEDAYTFGLKLIDTTDKKIKELSSILSEKDISLITISDKLAEQIMACSIAYYNEIQDMDKCNNTRSLTLAIDKILSPQRAYELASKAEKIAKSIVTLKRIQDNINIIQEILFSDCYRAVRFLDMVNEAYEKIKRENLLLSLFEYKQLNERKVLEDLERIVTKEIVKKIAQSDIEELISEFNHFITVLIQKMELSEYLKNLKHEFISQLPDTNSIKRKHYLKIINNRIEDLKIELRRLLDITFYSDEMEVLESQLKKLNNWNLFISKRKKELQIIEKNIEIDNLKAKSEKIKKQEISRVKKEIETCKKQKEKYIDKECL